jgi:ABC-2 type transport system ATP-binding protein
MEIFSLKNVTKKFGSFTAVNNLSFEVKPNHVIGFLGPNGAGKTTTIRMIVGLSQPTSGEITLFGKKLLFGDSQVRPNVGYLPELPSLYTWMTGQEYLSFFADLHKIANKKSRIDELFSIVNLESSRNKKIGTYSNGMRQRLGIAQAIINNPPLVILDEPVSALDPIGRKEVLKTIEKIKENATVIFSTHILSDVDKICDDVVILNKGKLVTSSPLTALKEQYAAQILTVVFGKANKEVLAKLEEQPWVSRADINEHQVKIWLKDATVVDENIPLEYFMKNGCGIIKYELAIPEIEDLFMELMESKNE